MLITTSPMVRISVNCTSLTEARIVVVRSETMESLIPGGIEASSCGNSFRIRSTVWITLAFGRRCTARMIAGVLSYQAAS